MRPSRKDVEYDFVMARRTEQLGGFWLRAYNKKPGQIARHTIFTGLNTDTSLISAVT